MIYNRYFIPLEFKSSMADNKILIFSSEDESNHSEYSFISSDEEVNHDRKDFKTSIYKMQDQMNLFMKQNPGVEIDFNSKPDRRVFI